MPTPTGGWQFTRRARRRCWRRTLDVSTFLPGRDCLGQDIMARLIRQERNCVEVRLLVDGIGVYLAAQARQCYTQDWAFATQGARRAAALEAEPVPACGTGAQLVASGPDQAEDMLYALLIATCFSARQRMVRRHILFRARCDAADGPDAGRAARRGGRFAAAAPLPTTC